MEPIDINDYVAGGYFVARPIPRTDSMTAELLPEQIISFSNCFATTINIFWAYDEQYLDQILEMGIKEGKLSDFKAWSASTAVGFPNVFYSLNAARDFMAEFIPETKNFSVFGVGLPKDMTEQFLVENLSAESKNKELFGTNLMISQNKSLMPNGNILGFEILSYWWTLLNHSWLCHHLEYDIFNTFGIWPNQFGLVDTYKDAMTIYKWLWENENRGTNEPYYPWLIVQYPLT